MSDLPKVTIATIADQVEKFLSGLQAREKEAQLKKRKTERRPPERKENRYIHGEGVSQPVIPVLHWI